MSEPVISVDNLSKRYRIAKARPAKPDRKRKGFDLSTSPFGYLVSTLRAASDDEILWALRDVSFSVQQGEVVGIIGKNGAGKSTLLKILSRITEPTSGQAVINGRVGSLLEVGTGFHPELTGRENIYLSGAILGMRRHEIDSKFDEIVEFSETARFLDMPVKRYSSGMYVRLAFAVAAHLEPEVLLVDEVLAVGDAAFQKKCLGKMGDVATQGRTVLFVSHNMVAVQNLCPRSLWIDQGRLVHLGETNQVVSKYLASSYSSVSERVWDEPQNAPGNEKVRLHRVAVRPVQGSPDDPITMATAFDIEVEYWNLVPKANLHVSLHFYTEQQIVAFTSTSYESENVPEDIQLETGLYKSICHVPGDFLNAGVQKVMLLIIQNAAKTIFRMEDALIFEVLELGIRAGAWFGKEPGVFRPKLDWQIITSQSKTKL